MAAAGARQGSDDGAPLPASTSWSCAPEVFTSTTHVRTVLLRTRRRRRQRACSRTRPQPSGTQDHRARTTLLRTQRHTRRSRCPRSSPHQSSPQHAHGAFSPMHCLTHRPYHPWWSRSTRTAPFSSSGFSPSSWSAIFPSCLQRIALRPHTSTHAPAARCATLARAHARTHAHGRPTVNDATCGPPARLTGRLHEGGARSVRSPLRRPPPLLATPIAAPLQGGRPKRPGLFVS